MQKRKSSTTSSSSLRPAAEEKTMPQPLPLIPGAGPKLSDIKHFGIRDHNRHTRKILTDHLDELYPAIFEARCKIQHSVDEQRNRFFNVQQKGPRFSRLISIKRPDGSQALIEVATSASYQIVLRDVISHQGEKLTAYIDNKDVVVLKMQMPTVILNSLAGKKLADVVELPEHYRHGDKPNPAIITKVFTRNQQIILRTTLWTAPSLDAPKIIQNDQPNPNQLDQNSIF